MNYSFGDLYQNMTPYTTEWKTVPEGEEQKSLAQLSPDEVVQPPAPANSFNIWTALFVLAALIVLFHL